MNDLSHPPILPFTETDDERCERLLEEQWEAAREECGREFDEWRGRDWRNREDADFSDWMVSMAQSHIRNHEKYEAALTWGERKRVGRAG